MTNKDTASGQPELQRYLDWHKNAQTGAEARNAKACIESFIKRAATQPVPSPALTETLCDCGCNEPVADDPIEMLEFLANRFEFAGVSSAVAEKYARDIRAILAAQGA